MFSIRKHIYVRVISIKCIYTYHIASNVKNYFIYTYIEIILCIAQCIYIYTVHIVYIYIYIWLIYVYIHTFWQKGCPSKNNIKIHLQTLLALSEKSLTQRRLWPRSGWFGAVPPQLPGQSMVPSSLNPVFFFVVSPRWLKPLGFLLGIPKMTLIIVLLNASDNPESLTFFW